MVAGQGCRRANWGCSTADRHDHRGWWSTSEANDARGRCSVATSKRRLDWRRDVAAAEEGRQSEV